MAVPRVANGQFDGVSHFMNSMAQEIDNMSIACKVRRTTDGIPIEPNTNYRISWESVEVDTFGGMWTPSDPDVLTIRHNGIYSLVLQVRWSRGSSTSPPYTDGFRSCYLLLNSVVPPSGVLTSDRKPASVTGEGVTLSCSTTATMLDGHKLYVGVSHSATATLDALHADFGGVYLAVNRIGPIP